MNIAVTGATGHVGINTCIHLLEKGHTVTALHFSPNKMTHLKDLDVKTMCGDILDLDFLKTAFEGIDSVIHLAAIISIDGNQGGKVWQINTEGSKNVVEACLHCGVKKLVHTSSIHAHKYTIEDEVVNEQTPYATAESFAYDWSKVNGELNALGGIKRGLEVVVINPTGIIGPNDYQPSLQGKMLMNLYHKKLPALLDAGFDWVDVRDVAAATLLALEKGKSGEKYMISGNWIHFNEFIKVTSSVTNKNLKKPLLPISFALIGLPFIKLFSKLVGIPPIYTYESVMILKHGNRNMSHEKATRELGYQPRPFEETIRDSYKWFGVKV